MAEKVKMVKYQRGKPLTEKKDIKYKKDEN